VSRSKTGHGTFVPFNAEPAHLVATARPSSLFIGSFNIALHQSAYSNPCAAAKAAARIQMVTPPIFIASSMM
jgi:hypothetical protein